MVLEAIAGLIALGYKMQQARVAVTNVYEHNENITMEDLIKKIFAVFCKFIRISSSFKIANKELF
jgi:Holliday junction resolvasome RuvABC DNA-binding subunit